MTESFADAIRQLRDSLTGPELDQFNKDLARVARTAMERYRDMDATVRAIAVLHRTGTGDKAGFCAECGNVMPCQTTKFIQPFLTP